MTYMTQCPVMRSLTDTVRSGDFLAFPDTGGWFTLVSGEHSTVGIGNLLARKLLPNLRRWFVATPTADSPLFLLFACWKLDLMTWTRRHRRKRSTKRRPLSVQPLEMRRLMVAEGSPFAFTKSVDTAGLSGSISAQIDWGDGTTSTAAVSGGTSTGPLKIRFDYRYDTGGFFTSSRRSLLQTAADALVKRLTDDLTAIRPSGTNKWTAKFTHPGNGSNATLNNLSVNANEILIFVGARDLPGASIGLGASGGWSASGSQAWLNTVRGRGESGALNTSAPTDFGPWGGSVSFDNRASWYFGADPDGLKSTQNDFLSVATHELAHVLGFGTASSFQRLLGGVGFGGAKAKAVYGQGGNVPMADAGHFRGDLVSDGQQPLMSNTIVMGTRKLMTPLDFAAMDDMGWGVHSTKGTISASHDYGDDGSYPVSIVMQGSGAGEKMYERSATVTNVAPDLTVVGNQTILVDKSLSLTDLGKISDPGFRNTKASPATNETFTYTVDWGDNTTPTTGTATIDQYGNANRVTLASFNGSHVYKSTGNYTVTVTVTDDDGGNDSASFRVSVTAPPQLILALDQTTIAENAGTGATQLRVSRPASATGSAVTVSLQSDASEISIPAQVTIVAGETTTVVPIDAVDDQLLDGTQMAPIRATAADYLAASIDLAVTDAEAIDAAFSSGSVIEGGNPVRLTVTRSNTDTQQPLTVNVGGTNRRLSLPGQVTIPAGQASTTIDVTAVDDDQAQLTASYNMTFTATGYTSDSAGLSVLDDEPPKFQNQQSPTDVDDQQGTTALDALLVINELSRRGEDETLDPQTDAFSGRYYDVNGDYLLTSFDALLVINELNRSAVSGESNPGPIVTSVAGPADFPNEDESSIFGNDSAADAAIAELF